MKISIDKLNGALSAVRLFVGREVGSDGRTTVRLYYNPSYVDRARRSGADVILLEMVPLAGFKLGNANVLLNRLPWPKLVIVAGVGAPCGTGELKTLEVITQKAFGERCARHYGLHRRNEVQTKKYQGASK